MKRTIQLIALCLPLFWGALAAAQKPDPKAKPDPNAQEIAKLKTELEAAKSEVSRLSAEIEKLKVELEAEKKARGEQGSPTTNNQELLDKLAAVETALSEAQDRALSLSLVSQNARRAALASQGQMTYKRHCATCHGANGDGKGVSREFLDQTPRDLTRGTYKFRSTPSGTLPTSEDIARTLRVGIPGTAMPGWQNELSPQEIAQLVAVIEGFSPRFSEEEPGVPYTIPSAPKFTPEMIKEGRLLYMALSCNQCHGDKGKGDGPSKDLKDETGEKMLATNFTKGVFKSGSSAQDLYRTIATGLDGTPMPSYYDSFSLSRENLESLAGRLYGNEAEELKKYAQTQPEAAPAPESPEAEQRRWAVVAYLQSIVKKRTFLDWLFRSPLRRYDTTR